MLIKALSAAAGNLGGGYSIENSLRFNDNDSAYLSRTPSVAGNRKTWTWSGWVKRGNLGSLQTLFAASNESTTQGFIYLASDDSFGYFDYISASNVDVKTNALLRDVSGWYHLVVVFDTTQATGSDRVKIYINGTEQTVTYTLTPSLNYEGSINTTGAHGIGREEYNNTYYFDGYLAEINFIDGQALTPDDFGEINATTGEWSPKAYAGTYGTNGFYLPFDGNANDDSGNGNNWTENNLASTDYMIDTPTNNFSTFSPLILNSLSLSEGNLRSIPTANTVNGITQGTQSVSSGKWYMEFDTSQGGSNGNCIVGVVGSSTYLNPSWFNASNGWSIDNNADGNLYKRHNGTLTSLGARASSAVLLMVAVDLDAGKIWFGQNGTWLEGDPSAGTGASYEDVFLEVQAATYQYDNRGSGDVIIANFGQDSSFAGNKTRQGNTDANGKGDFYYAPPAGGYLALCTDNLPAPTIEQPETQFNVLTYTGAGATQSVTGLDFQPDLVWVKRRNDTSNHQLHNSVSGSEYPLYSNLTNAEGTSPNTITSFNSDGFTIAGSSGNLNTSGSTYVAWCWKAGGTAVSNTDGSITSQVSANVDSGFSIVGYTGTGSTATVGHGLSQAPEVMIVKNRNDIRNWCVYAKPIADISVNNILFLDTTDAIYNASNVFGALPTATVFTVQTNPAVNGSGNNLIAYCFHSVEGVSKIGSYVGNGSANGTFVYTGFKPAFVLVKRTNTFGNWMIQDTTRSPYNASNTILLANGSGAEQSNSAWNMDFLSNGFKPRSADGLLNNTNDTYIYMAFAEHPFKYATGR